MLRYGIVGAGFVSAFHLRALESVRGVEVAGITSRTPPVELAESARARGLGEATVFDSVTEMLPHVDVVAVFAPNDARLAVMEEVAAGGDHLRGLIIEKPLGRNLAEARRVVELANGLGVPTAYFENQIHMKAITNARAQLEATARAMGPLVLARSGEEHAGPHNAWFWDPTRQGGGVLSDMGCHSIAVGWYLLTPPGKGVRHLVPETVSAEVGLLKWGQPRWRAELLDEHGVDYTKTPAEDFATGIITYRDPDTDHRSKAQFTVSWMYDKQGLRLLMDAIGPGYALEVNTLRSPLELFIGDDAAASVADAETALEKATASRGPARRPAQRTGPVRLRRRAHRRPRRLRAGGVRPARPRLRPGDRPADHGLLPLCRGGPGRRPDRPRDPRTARRLHPADPAGPRRRGAVHAAR